MSEFLNFKSLMLPIQKKICITAHIVHRTVAKRWQEGFCQGRIYQRRTFDEWPCQFSYNNS